MKGWFFMCKGIKDTCNLDLAKSHIGPSRARTDLGLIEHQYKKDFNAKAF